MRRLLALSLALACGGGSGPSRVSGSFPLLPGRWWAYRGVDDTSRWDTLKVLSDSAYGNYDAYSLLQLTPADSDTDLAYYDEEGFLHIVDELRCDSPLVLRFEVDQKLLPPELLTGDTWTVFHAETTVAAGYVNLTVHATALVLYGEEKGGFTAMPVRITVRYRPEGGGLSPWTERRTLWFAEGVGFVWREDSTWRGITQDSLEAWGNN